MFHESCPTGDEKPNGSHSEPGDQEDPLLPAVPGDGIIPKDQHSNHVLGPGDSPQFGTATSSIRSSTTNTAAMWGEEGPTLKAEEKARAEAAEKARAEAAEEKAATRIQSAQRARARKHLLSRNRAEAKAATLIQSGQRARRGPREPGAARGRRGAV